MRGVTAARRLTLVGKPDCHLCHEMRAVVARIVDAADVIERDVRDDPVLERRYVFEIPVLLLGEVEVARHRVSAAELQARLAELDWR